MDLAYKSLIEVEKDIQYDIDAVNTQLAQPQNTLYDQMTIRSQENTKIELHSKMQYYIAESQKLIIFPVQKFLPSFAVASKLPIL